MAVATDIWLHSFIDEFLGYSRMRLQLPRLCTVERVGEDDYERR